MLEILAFANCLPSAESNNWVNIYCYDLNTAFQTII